MSKTITFVELQKTEAYLRDKSTRQTRFARLRTAAEINAAATALNEDEAVALADAVRQEWFTESSAAAKTTPGSR
jgi:hypothetical protein